MIDCILCSVVMLHMSHFLLLVYDVNIERLYNLDCLDEGETRQAALRRIYYGLYIHYVNLS